MLIIQNKNFSTSDSVMASFHNSRYVNKAHIHQFAELMYVIDGELTVISSGKTEIARKGDVAIIQPYQPHGYFTERDKKVKVWLLLFSSSLISDFLNKQSGHLRYKNSVFTPAEHIQRFIEARTFDTGEKKTELDPVGIRKIKATLYPIFDDYVSKIPLLDEYDSSSSSAIGEAMLYLSSHFKENVKMGDVARAIGYSESYLSKCIRETFGINFRTLLNSIRIEHAKSLLITKESNTFLAGLESGFGCERSFHRAFIDITGMSPKEYKKRGRWVNLEATIEKTRDSKAKKQIIRD